MTHATGTILYEIHDCVNLVTLTNTRFTFFAPVSLTMTRWPWYVIVAKILLWRYTVSAYNNEVSVLNVRERTGQDRQTDRQTRRHTHTRTHTDGRDSTFATCVQFLKFLLHNYYVAFLGQTNVHQVYLWNRLPMKHVPPVLTGYYIINWLSGVWKNISWCHI